MKFRWLATVTAAAALLGGAVHADQLADIKAKGELVVGVLGTDEPQSYIDPKTRELVGYLGRFKEAKRRLILINPAERVRRLLQVAQLDDLFPTFDSVDAALAAHLG